MNWKRHLAAGLAICVSLFPSQANAQSKSTESTKANGQMLAKSTTDLGIALLKKLAARPGNVFISPLSISTCLEMGLSGARGTTAQQMKKALFLPDVDLSKLQADYKAFMAEIGPRSDNDRVINVIFEIANSMWANKTAKIQPSFKNMLATNYSAEFQTLDFGNSSASGTINSWVSKKTHGKISSVIERLDPQALLILVNSAYFKGSWLHQFEKSNTTPIGFYINGAKTATKVPTMAQSEHFDYFEDGSLQVIRLPYKDFRYSMYILLPRKTPVEQFIEQLTPDAFRGLMAKVQHRPGSVQMPKFKMEYKILLNELMPQLGMIDAFDPKKADFTGMVIPPPSAFVSSIIHKTFVEVNEEGTEAAAVTAMAMAGGAMPPPDPPFKMIVDRPFMFALVNDNNQSIMFAGVMEDPR